MKFAKAGLVAAVLVLAVTSALAMVQSNPTGYWVLTVDTPQGGNTATLTLQQDGDKLTGELSNQMGSAPVTGTFSDGLVAATASIDMQGSSLQIGINGKIEADAFSGTLKFGDLAEFPFVGKRAPAAAAAPAPVSPSAPADAPLAPPAADINGKWDVVLSIAGIGEFPLTADVKQDGNKVAGKLTGQAGDVTANGTLSGSSLKLEFVVVTPSGAVPVILTGELGAEGFTGKATLAGLGEADWKGTRGK